MIEYYPVNLNSYLKFLLEDIKKNSRAANLISGLFLPNTISIEKWVTNILPGKNFLDYQPKLDFQGFFPTVQKVQEVNHNFFYYTGEDVKDLYCFFSKIECASYEEVQEKFPQSYYVFNLRFFTKVNNLIFNSLKEYEFSKDRKAYIKKIASTIFIKLKPYNNFNKHSGINEYLFPQIIIEIDRKNYYFFREGDLRHFLFLPGLSFMFFYLESNTVTFNDMGVMKVEKKNDEPIVYYKEESKQYTITNRYEKLKLYNKYIFILLDLYIHYFRVFEKWLIGQLVGETSKNI